MCFQMQCTVCTQCIGWLWRGEHPGALVCRFSPLCAFKCTQYNALQCGAQNNQGALRRLLISDPKLPPTRPTICISSLLINYFLRPAICISSQLINYFPQFPQFVSLAPAKYLSVATICSFSFQWKRHMFTK